MVILVAAVVVVVADSILVVVILVADYSNYSSFLRFYFYVFKISGGLYKLQVGEIL